MRAMSWASCRLGNPEHPDGGRVVGVVGEALLGLLE
jgi:hypothetical protein